MIQVKTQRYIKCSTVESVQAWLVVAVVVERVGNGPEVVISEPRIVKVIAKTTPLLKGSVASHLLSGSNPPAATHTPIRSPYAQSIGYFNTDVLAWYGPQPPTK